MCTASRNTAALWTTRQRCGKLGRLICTLDEVHSDWVHDIAVSADGRVVVTGSKDKTAALWDPITGDVIHHLQGVHTAAVTSVSIDGNAQVVCTGSRDRKVGVWDVVTGDNCLFCPNSKG